LGALQHDPPNETAQPPPACRPRSRTCLLEGCGRVFTPVCARSRYCCQTCRQQARQWSLDKAQEAWRKSEKGRAARREQARRWRQRQRQKPDNGSQNPTNPPQNCEGHQRKQTHEGHHKEPAAKKSGKVLCDRPGCYATFIPSSRSPRRRFCCSLCRQAFRRMVLREKHWRPLCHGCPFRHVDLCQRPTRGP